MNSRIGSATATRWLASVAFAWTISIAGGAHAGNGKCLWDQLSLPTHDDAIALIQTGGIEGFNNWRPPARELQQAVSICVAPGGDARSAVVAMGAYLVEDQITTYLNRKYGLSAAALAGEWGALSEIDRANFRSEAKANSANSTSNHQAEERVMAKIMSQFYIRAVARTPAAQLEIYRLLAKYYYFRAMSDFLEASF